MKVKLDEKRGRERLLRLLRLAPVAADESKGEWLCVDMQAVGPMPTPTTLVAIKAEPKFSELALVRQSRLSVMPIAPEHWKLLCKMGGWKG